MTRPRSSFEALLRQAGTPDIADGDTEARGPIGSTPWFIPETPGLAQWTDEETAAGAYEDASEPDIGEAPEVPRALPATAIEDIERELDLATCRTVDELRHRRRKFARNNHPDMLHASLRAVATERMMIANRLIDGEIRKRRISAQ